MGEHAGGLQYAHASPLQLLPRDSHVDADAQPLSAPGVQISRQAPSPSLARETPRHM